MASDVLTDSGMSHPPLQTSVVVDRLQRQPAGLSGSGGGSTRHGCAICGSKVQTAANCNDFYPKNYRERFEVAKQNNACHMCLISGYTKRSISTCAIALKRDAGPKMIAIMNCFVPSRTGLSVFAWYQAIRHATAEHDTTTVTPGDTMTTVRVDQPVRNGRFQNAQPFNQGSDAPNVTKKRNPKVKMKRNRHMKRKRRSPRLRVAAQKDASQPTLPTPFGESPLP